MHVAENQTFLIKFCDGNGCMDAQVYEALAAALQEGKEPCVVPVDMVSEWTDNFSAGRVVGEGAFGKVYQGLVVSDVARHANAYLRVLAVKQLSPDMIPEGGEKHLRREIAVLRYGVESLYTATVQQRHHTYTLL
jgi:hypothetical protein